MQRIKSFVLPFLILVAAVSIGFMQVRMPVAAAGLYSMTADTVNYWDVDPIMWGGPTGNCAYVSCNSATDLGNSCWSSFPTSNWSYLCYMGDASNCGNLIHTEYSCKGPSACVPNTACAASTCTTDTCDDGCGNPVAGAKVCSACVAQKGATCHNSSACDYTTGTYQCDGSCSAAPAAEPPSGYGSSCPSAPNSCGKVDTSGSIQCNGSCSSVPPPDSVCAGAADLSAGSVAPASAVAGTATTFSASITNSGSATTGSSFTSLLQKAIDAAGTGAVDEKTFSISTLAAGAATTGSVSYTFPSADTGTTKYLRVCADKSSGADAKGSIVESNEGNNCGAWSPVVVSGASGASDPTVTFSGSPLTIAPGSSSTLTWSSTNATSCTAVTPGFSTGGAASGTTSTGPLTSSTTYGISCSGAGKTSPVVFVTIVVTGSSCTDGGPVSLTATPNRIQSGNTSVLTWAGSNVSSSCTISGPGISQSASPSACVIEGSVSTPVLTSQATYTLSCPGGQKAQAIVNIVPTVRED